MSDRELEQMDIDDKTLTISIEMYEEQQEQHNRHHLTAVPLCSSITDNSSSTVQDNKPEVYSTGSMVNNKQDNSSTKEEDNSSTTTVDNKQVVVNNQDPADNSRNLKANRVGEEEAATSTVQAAVYNTIHNSKYLFKLYYNNCNTSTFSCRSQLRSLI